MIHKIWENFPANLVSIFEGFFDSLKSENMYREFIKRGWKINHFCEIIRSDPKGLRKCLVSDAHGETMARQNKTPCYYTCPFGLVDIVFPIFVRNRFVTSIYMGGSILTESPTTASFVQLKEKVKGMKIDLKKLEKAYFETIVVPEEKLKQYINLVMVFFNYLTNAEELLLKGTQQPERNPLIEKAEGYIRDNYYENLSLEQVSRQAGLNSFNFTRLFKDEMGQTFLQYLTSLRMEKAKELLVTTDSKITDIGTSVGYDNITHFNRMFKQTEKISPREYRQLFKKTISG